jgi:hypothetical protein
VKCSIYCLIAFFSLQICANARADECPREIKTAIDAAKEALSEQKAEQDHRALECLVQAVAALDKKLEALRDGSLPFTGKLQSKGGVNISRDDMEAK